VVCCDEYHWLNKLLAKWFMAGTNTSDRRFLNTYKYWLENEKDWCISRQLWWGQRIPAWYDKEWQLLLLLKTKKMLKGWLQMLTWCRTKMFWIPGFLLRSAYGSVQGE
jgi:valyl-tRNA synthetase